MGHELQMMLALQRTATAMATCWFQSIVVVWQLLHCSVDT
jgi:hypothetical protein